MRALASWQHNGAGQGHVAILEGNIIAAQGNTLGALGWLALGLPHHAGSIALGVSLETEARFAHGRIQEACTGEKLIVAGWIHCGIAASLRVGIEQLREVAQVRQHDHALVREAVGAEEAFVVLRGGGSAALQGEAAALAGCDGFAIERQLAADRVAIQFAIEMHQAFRAGEVELHAPLRFADRCQRHALFVIGRHIDRAAEDFVLLGKLGVDELGTGWDLENANPVAVQRACQRRERCGAHGECENGSVQCLYGFHGNSVT